LHQNLLPRYVARIELRVYISDEDDRAVKPSSRMSVVGSGADSDPSERMTVLGIPAADGADEVALAMLRTLTLVRQVGLTRVVVSAVLPTSTRGMRGLIQDAAPAAILVAAVGPGGLTEARYLCLRLRDEHPGVKLIVGRWGQGKDPRKARTLLLSAGADRVPATLREARAYLARLVHPRPAGCKPATTST
jgi:hypothetical protein